MTDEQGFTIEAAYQFGFQGSGHNEGKDTDTFLCTQSQLLTFAKACERKGMANAHAMGSRDIVWREIQKIDAELKPILEAEEVRYMTVQGYVRGSDEPGKRWVKLLDRIVADLKRRANGSKDQGLALADWLAACKVIPFVGDFNDAIELLAKVPAEDLQRIAPVLFLTAPTASEDLA